MTIAAERLGAVRRAYRQRRDRRTNGDIVFALYLALLLVPVVGFPVVRGIVVMLAEPTVVSLLQSTSAPRVVGVACGVFLAGLAGMGRLYGPVTLQPIFVTLLADTDLPRSRTLLRPFVMSALVVTTSSLVAGVLIGGVLVHVGAAPVAAGVRFVIASLFFGLIGGVTWLAGQAVRPRYAWIPPAAILATTAIGAVFPPSTVVTPWGWVGLSWPTSASSGPWPAVLLMCTAVAAAWCVRRLLDSLRSTRLMEEAEKWRSVGTAALSGDVASALGGFRARPTVGRTWTALSGRTTPGRFLVRDLLGGMRTPGRLVLGSAVLVVACCTVAVAPTGNGWLLAGLGSGLGFLALGVFSDGFRHAAEAGVAPPLYGYPTALLYVLHAVLPTVAVLAAVVLGVVLAVVSGASASSAAGVGLVFLVLVVVRAYHSAKGPLPVVLLTPVPTPLGDLSSLHVAIWQADALLIAAGAGGVIAAVAAGGAVIHAAVIAAALTCALLLALRRRLARL